MHRRAEVGVGVGELEADHAAADDDDLGGNVVKRGRLVARPHALERVIDARQQERHRAGREDDRVGLDRAHRSARSRDLDGLGRGQPTLAVHDVDLEALGAALDLADELVDHALLARAQRGHVDRCASDAVSP